MAFLNKLSKIHHMQGGKKRKQRSDKILIDDRSLKMLETFGALHLSQEQICATMGFSRETLFRRMQEDPRIAEAIERGKANGIAKVSETAYRMATSGRHPDMTKFMLKCKGGWKETHHIDVQTKVVPELALDKVESSPELQQAMKLIAETIELKDGAE